MERIPDGMEVYSLELATASICFKSTDVGTLYLTEKTFFGPTDGSVGVGSCAEVCFAAFLALPLSLGVAVLALGTGRWRRLCQWGFSCGFRNLL
jgi:hypothetical protein